MDLFCDNYSVCKSMQRDRGHSDDTEKVARARGWHIFHGEDNGGKPHDAVLCGKCVDVKRHPLKPAPPLQPGQVELFEFTVYHD